MKTHKSMTWQWREGIQGKRPTSCIQPSRGSVLITICQMTLNYHVFQTEGFYNRPITAMNGVKAEPLRYSVWALPHETYIAKSLFRIIPYVLPRSEVNLQSIVVSVKALMGESVCTSKLDCVRAAFRVNRSERSEREAWSGRSLIRAVDGLERYSEPSGLKQTSIRIRM